MDANRLLTCSVPEKPNMQSCPIFSVVVMPAIYCINSASSESGVGDGVSVGMGVGVGVLVGCWVGTAVMGALVCSTTSTCRIGSVGAHANDSTHNAASSKEATFLIISL